MRIIRPPPLKFKRKMTMAYYGKKVVKIMARISNDTGFRAL